MAQLGQAERITYTAKELRSGLSDIEGYVKKPSGVTIGPFPLVEFSDTLFKGIYYFDFQTNLLTDDYGTYIVMVVSPTEKHRTPVKIVFDKLSIGELNDIVAKVNDAIKRLNQVDINVTVEDIDEISVSIIEGNNA